MIVSVILKGFLKPFDIKILYGLQVKYKKNYLGVINATFVFYFL